MVEMSGYVSNLVSDKFIYKLLAHRKSVWLGLKQLCDWGFNEKDINKNDSSVSYAMIPEVLSKQCIGSNQTTAQKGRWGLLDMSNPSILSGKKFYLASMNLHIFRCGIITMVPDDLFSINQVVTLIRILITYYFN